MGRVCFFRRPKGTRRQSPTPLRSGVTRCACDHLRATALRLGVAAANSLRGEAEGRLMPQRDVNPLIFTTKNMKVEFRNRGQSNRGISRASDQSPEPLARGRSLRIAH